MSMGNIQNSKFTGGYGFVAVPDQKTIDKCYSLVAERFPADWEYLLGSKNLPHVTLYHSRMKGVPSEFATETREKLSSTLCGLTFSLKDLQCFGAKFIFWNIDPSDSSYELLLKAHQDALQLSKYLDPTAPKRAEEEGLSLSPKEKENVELFNHPLVRDLFTPHITLAYDEKANGFLKDGETDEFTMTIERVEFAEIGFPGIVTEVVDL